MAARQGRLWAGLVVGEAGRNGAGAGGRPAGPSPGGAAGWQGPDRAGWPPAGAVPGGKAEGAARRRLAAARGGIIVCRMEETATPKLRRGWTTGACATAATRAALMALWGGDFPERVRITLPGGERPQFAVVNPRRGRDGATPWAEAGIIKDAGDDPDVTHGCEIRARVAPLAGGGGRAGVAGGGGGIRFRAGEGVGVVTKPGLPIPPGEPAINPRPREMICAVVEEMAARYGKGTDIEITISIPGGAEIAARTWNPRLGIRGGLSVLGTTGIVRPFSCAAWIASIHRGIDVARATGLSHVAGCTGATSEAAVRALHALPEEAMLDMGDFAGGLIKYLRRHPVPRLTIAGGIGKMTKLAQGARDLHSARSQVDFAALAAMLGDARLQRVNTALEAYEIAGETMARMIAQEALGQVRAMLGDAPVRADVVIVDRGGRIIAAAGPGDAAGDAAGDAGGDTAEDAAGHAERHATKGHGMKEKQA